MSCVARRGRWRRSRLKLRHGTIARHEHRAAAVSADDVRRLGQPAQLEIIDYLKEENRVLRQQLGGRRLRFTDDQRRRLAVKGRVLGRRVLDELSGLVTPDTILPWYRELSADKYEVSGSATVSAGPGCPQQVDARSSVRRRGRL
jgi:hypothetical protein